MSALFNILDAGWSILHSKEAYAARKAMKLYKKYHPICEITGSTKNVQVHHIIPVWADPTKAADPDNFISLSTCSNVHLLFGHGGNYANRYVGNIRDVAERIREIKSQSIIVNREVRIKSTKNNWINKLINYFN